MDKDTLVADEAVRMDFDRPQQEPTPSEESPCSGGQTRGWAARQEAEGTWQESPMELKNR